MVITKEQAEAYRNSPGFQAQLAAYREKHPQASEQEVFNAVFTPAPGALLAAMEPEPIKAAGLTLQPICAAQFIFLQKLNNSFYRKAFKEQATELDPEDVIETLFLFTTPIAECRSIYRCGGKENFHEEAMLRIADRLSPMALQAVEVAVMAHLTAAMSTQVNIVPVKEAEDANPTKAAGTSTASECSSTPAPVSATATRPGSTGS